jgi:hypothetical protein
MPAPGNRMMYLRRLSRDGEWPLNEHCGGYGLTVAEREKSVRRQRRWPAAVGGCGYGLLLGYVRCARGWCHRTAAARGAEHARGCACAALARRRAQNSRGCTCAALATAALLVGEGSRQSRCFHDLCTGNIRQDIQPEYHLPHRKRVVYKSSSSMLGIRIAFP